MELMDSKGDYDILFGFGFKTKGYKHDTIKQWLNDLYKESSILKTSPNGMLLKIGRKFQYDKHREAFEEIFVKPIVKGEWDEIRNVMEEIETHTGRIVSEDEQLQAIKEMFESERYLLISEETDKLLYDLHQKISDTRPSEKEMAQHACFMAGTLVHTDKGLVPINKIKVGDKVLSRDENNPDAENVYKRVVSTFKSAEKKRIIHQRYLTEEGDGYLFCTEDHPIWADHFKGAVEDENGKLIPERTHDGWIPALYLSSYDKHALRTVDNGLAFIESFETTSKATSILGKNCIGLWDNGYGEYADEFITVTEDDYTIWERGYRMRSVDGVTRAVPEPSMLLPNEKVCHYMPGEEPEYYGEPVEIAEDEGKDYYAYVYNIEVEDTHTYFVGAAGIWVHNCGGAARNRK